MREQQRRYQERVQAWLREQRETTPCRDCGGEFPHYVKEYHHRDPSTKTREVGRMRSIPQMQREMAKCDLLCANCHLIRHAEQAA